MNAADDTPEPGSATPPVPLEKRDRQPAQPSRPVAEAEIRASDADRDRIAGILREALAEGRLDAEEHAERIDLVYRAKTMGELEPVVRDLPVAADSGPRPASGAYAAGPPVPDQNLVAVFSASVRKGRWQVPARINAVAIFGSVEIDLTEAVFPQQQVQITVTAILGSVEIRVPENITLRSSGSGVLGAFEVETHDAAEADAPQVQVNGFALLGSVEAKPKRGALLRDLRDRLREQRLDRRARLHHDLHGRRDRFRKDRED
ncbi:DUF1707 domain-containing protein [Streptomyces sp. Pv4-95]|uniref:DUF1707 SHOCT-like domain-containing protein n=1 Tax=Streptomyces sp. Pv4-95 TaxID=3049543 RepID=UPI0038918759